jgi:hypothetical protein
MDLSPAEKRQESHLPPKSAPLSRNGPTTHRDSERLAILSNLTDERTRPISHASEPSVAAQSLQQPSSPQTHAAAPPPTQVIAEKSQLTSEPTSEPVGFFSQLKESFLRITGLGGSSKTSEPGDEKPGFFARVANQLSKLGDVRSLADLGSWAKDVANACVPRMRLWTRPAQKPTVPQSLNIKPPAQTATHETPTRHTETVIIVPPKEHVLELERETKPSENLTEKALTTLTEAKQAQNEEKEKKEAREESSKRHHKENADAALRRLQLEGLSPTELAEISAELHGVYGSADVALRNANELLKRKKVS